ncbi:MAG: hypothetical protein M9894_32485 [Planctomycetes bacterium]|nr:hypothetical protein [Planctomycetota bacterium]
MRVVITPAGRRTTPAHPTVTSPGLAVVASPAGDGEVLALVGFCAPRDAALAYARLHEAVALLVDVPDAGLCAAELLIDREVHREPAGPNWLGAPPPPDGFAGSFGGSATARIEVHGLTRPTTVYVRAALRDLVSPACAVELRPPPAPDAPAGGAPSGEEG